MSKHNFRSQKGYSIETTILEKKLMHDNSLLNGIKNVHVISDLEACYDKHLLNIDSIAEESLGVERKSVKLVTKTIAAFEHYLCTSFGISSVSCGGTENKLGGTGQGNCMSRADYRDQSCLIFRKIENEKLGAMTCRPTQK